MGILTAIFFSSWEGVGRIIITTLLAYVSIVLILRISGKRTLAKMNAFDLVVTVALGSSLASIGLSKSVKLVDGLAGIITLVGLQYLIAWASVRFKIVQKLVKSDPRLLFHKGNYLETALRDERVTESEVQTAARNQGFLSMQQVAAVVLETDGSFSVMGRADEDYQATALQHVVGADHML